MSTTEFIDLFEKLPADKQREVESLLSELINQSKSSENEKPRMELKSTGLVISDDINVAITQMGKEKRKFGDLKGFVTYMDDDFNKPMDDFNAYM